MHEDGVARWEVFAILFIVGAAIMAVEILGTRVIGPVFCVNLFVWSALLSVTLGALAIGYYAGGVWVDRAPGMRVLGFIVTGGGVLLGLVPMVSPTVLSVAGSLGPRAGSLVAATCLFAPTLAVLGLVGPAAIRLTAKGVSDAGRGAGSIYAISTAGARPAPSGPGFSSCRRSTATRSSSAPPRSSRSSAASLASTGIPRRSPPSPSP